MIPLTVLSLPRGSGDSRGGVGGFLAEVGGGETSKSGVEPGAKANRPRGRLSIGENQKSAQRLASKVSMST